MVGQQQSNATATALFQMRQAEQKVVTALQHASLALRALSTVDASQSSSSFNQHSDAFISNLHDAQRLVRDRIQQLGADLPFENIMMRRLIEGDLALQRTAHVHRALLYALSTVGVSPVPDTSVAGNAAAPSSVPSPPYMPSPAASTPQTAFPGIAASSPITTAPLPILVHGTDHTQGTQQAFNNPQPSDSHGRHQNNDQSGLDSAP